MQRAVKTKIYRNILTGVQKNAIKIASAYRIMFTKALLDLMRIPSIDLLVEEKC